MNFRCSNKPATGKAGNQCTKIIEVENPADGASVSCKCGAQYTVDIPYGFNAKGKPVAKSPQLVPVS